MAIRSEGAKRSWRLVLGVMCGLLVFILILFSRDKWSSSLVTFFGKTNLQNLAFTLAAGTLSGVLAIMVYGRYQKDVWKSDTATIEAKVVEIGKVVQELGTTYQCYLDRLPDAIGGEFTKSLFAYPPFASKGLAQILSRATGDLYSQHAQRVLVIKGQDQYLIDKLSRFTLHSDVMVWSLRFRTTWTWSNDSSVTKYPLADLVFVTAANSDALNSFSSTSAGAAQQQKQLADFYKQRKNIVQAIAVNPADRSQHLNADEIAKVFSIEEIRVRHDEEVKAFTAADLKSLNSECAGGLPRGIYAAQMLPNSTGLPALDPGCVMSIDYVGHVSLAAGREGDEFTGYLAFTPSDIVAEEYELTLYCPREIGGKEMQFDIDHNLSGSQYLHEPLARSVVENTDRRSTEMPRELATSWTGGKSATITGPKPLTSLHRIALTWKGKVINDVSVTNTEAEQNV